MYSSSTIVQAYEDNKIAVEDWEVVKSNPCQFKLNVSRQISGGPNQNPYQQVLLECNTTKSLMSSTVAAAAAVINSPKMSVKMSSGIKSENNENGKSYLKTTRMIPLITSWNLLSAKGIWFELDFLCLLGELRVTPFLEANGHLFYYMPTNDNNENKEGNNSIRMQQGSFQWKTYDCWSCLPPDIKDNSNQNYNVNKTRKANTFVGLHEFKQLLKQNHFLSLPDYCDGYFKTQEPKQIPIFFGFAVESTSSKSCYGFGRCMLQIHLDPSCLLEGCSSHSNSKSTNVNMSSTLSATVDMNDNGKNSPITMDIFQLISQMHRLKRDLVEEGQLRSMMEVEFLREQEKLREDLECLRRLLYIKDLSLQRKSDTLTQHIDKIFQLEQQVNELKQEMTHTVFVESPSPPSSTVLSDEKVKKYEQIAKEAVASMVLDEEDERKLELESKKIQNEIQSQRPQTHYVRKVVGICQPSTTSTTTANTIRKVDEDWEILSKSPGTKL